MMNTKLTLTIERSIIDKAKRYARKRDRSLSDLVESYLRALTNEKESDKEELSPELKRLRGSFKLPKDLDYKKEITSSLEKKYF
jgi:hypothetical protein